MICAVSQHVQNLLEQFESLPEIEKGQVSDQLTIELTIVQDFCEAAKIRLEKERRENDKKIDNEGNPQII